MVSAFVDEERGFGFPLAPAEVAAINLRLAQAGKPLLKKDNRHPTSSPGLVFFKYGSAREGFWNCDCLATQLELLMDCFEAVKPNRQLLVEIDWSSGHTKMDEQGLNVGRMNASWGGKQPVMRSTTVTAECLGNDSILKPGQIQSLVFLENEKPHFDEAAPPFDCKRPKAPTTGAKKRKQCSTVNERNNKKENDATSCTTTVAAARERGEEGCQNNDSQEEGNNNVDPVNDNNNNNSQEEETIVIGYVGKPKGAKQVLYERGLYDKSMNLDRMKQRLAQCPDFAGEMGIIKSLVHKRGHILLLSPKCHPEVAGVGVEYCWGKSKLTFRQKTNDTQPKNLHQNVLCSLESEHLPLFRVRHYARKTRDYLQVYDDMKEAREEAAAAASAAATNASQADSNTSVQGCKLHPPTTVLLLSEHEALAAARKKLDAKSSSCTADEAMLRADQNDGYATIEKMLASKKAHRNIVDIDSVTINSL